jgi:hypothetical protein
MIVLILIFYLIILIILIIKTLYIKLDNFENNIKIPKVIYLSYKTKDIPDYVIPKWKEIYPDYEVKLYDNKDCIEFLNKEYNKEYVDIFNYIKDGPIKADFWRVCILYKYGGIYSDIDVEPVVNINKIIDNDTTFITCLSAQFKNINPHFIVTIPNHKVLKMCIDKYLTMYRDKKKYTYWGWSIVFIMKKVLYEIFDKYLTKDGVYYDKDNNKYQFLKEIIPLPESFFNLKELWLRFKNTGRDMYCKYNDIIILNNKYDGYLDHEFK